MGVPPWVPGEEFITTGTGENNRDKAARESRDGVIVVARG